MLWRWVGTALLLTFSNGIPTATTTIPQSALDEISVCARVEFIGIGKSSAQHERLSLLPASFAVEGQWSKGGGATLAEFAAAWEGGSRDSLGVFRLAGNRTLRWVESQPMCARLASHFGQLVFVGDSVLRQLTNLVFALLRDSLQYGALKDWLFSPRADGEEPAFMCRCGRVFDCGIAPRLDRSSSAVEGVESYVNATAHSKTESHYDFLHYFRDSYILRSTNDADYWRTALPVCASAPESVAITQLWRPLPADLVDDAEMDALLRAQPRSLVVFDTGMWNKHRLNESSLYFSHMLDVRARHPAVTLLYHGQHYLPNRTSETHGFNDAMRALCARHNVLYFDTDALTKGRALALDCDPDCVHYGFDLALLKAQALFSFLSLV